MRLAMLAAAALLLQEATPLSYGGRQGDGRPIRGEIALDLSIDGTEAVVNMVRSAMEILTFSRIRIRGEGRRYVERADPKGVLVKTQLLSARVDGKYDDEPYEFDFDAKAPPADLQENKLKAFCWALGMSPRDVELTPIGEYRFGDRNQDAWQEALGVIVLSVVRLPEKPPAPGNSWTCEWKTKARQKDNEARFRIVQTAKLEKIEEKEKRRRARISYEFKGTLEIPEDKKNRNAEKEETLCSATGEIVLDLGSRMVVASSAKGGISSHVRSTDPGSGEVVELKVRMGLESKFEERD